jgi:type III pantothenate kinase
VTAIATVSLGNSFTRCGVWSQGELIPGQSCRTSELAGAGLFSVCPGASGARLAAVASVVPQSEELLSDLLRRQLGLVPRYLGRDLPVPLVIEVEEPGSVGPDRLAAALAAQRTFGAAVVVDFGTAITVDAVTASGCYQGGAILPGPELCLRGLAAGTAGVRLSGLAEAVAPPGRSTRAAVDAGLSHGLAGAVDRLVEATRESLGHEAALVATGGGAGFFKPLCRSRFRLRPHLVLEGLALAAEESV